MQFPFRHGVRRRMLAAALVIGLPLGMAACSSSSDSGSSSESASSSAASMPAEMTSVSVGVIPIIDVAPIYLGVKQGFFSDKNLDLTMELAQGGAAIVPAVVSGQYQFGFSNTVSLILGNTKGLNLVGVASGNQTTGVDGQDFGAVIVKGDSSIQSAADLAGKKVAVNTLNNILSVSVNEAVRKAGGDPSSITYVELAFPDMPAAVANGDVDAAAVVEPFVTIGEGQGDRQVSSYFAVTDPNLQIAEYFTSKAYAADHPEVVAAFTAAMNESLDYAQAHPDEVRSILLEYTKLDEAGAAAVTLPKWDSAVSKDAMTHLADLMQQDGLIDSTPDLTDLLP